MAASPTDMVSRTATTDSDDNAPIGDPTSTMGLLLERVRAYKHMVSNLEDYVKAVAKYQANGAKEQEKIVKSIYQPLQETHHFDAANNGVAGLFENLRSNTAAIATLHTETAQNLNGTVLPALERVHKELKAKFKELESGSAKQAKAVDKSRVATQKYIDLLTHHSTASGKVEPSNDPYLLQRGIYHRLNLQINDENNARSDLLTVQNAFGGFEAHVLDTIQNALSSFSQFMGGQTERQGTIYTAMANTARAIPQDFEWTSFVHRNQAALIDPRSPTRNLGTATFPGQNHASTQPLIEGTLERKARGMGALTGYKSYHYALTPAGYLHEFKDSDDLKKEPTPEITLALADCTIGALDGSKFNIKGKDVSGNKMSAKMAISSEWQFKAHSPADAQKWYAAVTAQAANKTDSTPVSPVSPASGGTQTIDSAVAPQQETGVTPVQTAAEPAGVQRTATDKEIAHQQQVQSQAQAPPGPPPSVAATDSSPPVYRPAPSQGQTAGQETGTIAHPPPQAQAPVGAPTQAGVGASPAAGVPISPVQNRQVSSPISGSGAGALSPVEEGGQRSVSGGALGTGIGRSGTTGGNGTGQGSHFHAKE